MIASGLTKQQLAHVANLEEMEEVFTAKDSVFVPVLVARALTCLAHDYVEMGLEEKGHELLLKADKIFPGYHGEQMKKDMDKDPEFAILVRSLSMELILAAVSNITSNT